MNLGMPEMIFIFLLALIIFGPKKLPEIGRQLGKALTDFKRASNDFKFQLEDEIRQLESTQPTPPVAQPAAFQPDANSIAPPPALEGTVAYRPEPAQPEAAPPAHSTVTEAAEESSPANGSAAAVAGAGATTGPNA